MAFNLVKLRPQPPRRPKLNIKYTHYNVWNVIALYGVSHWKTTLHFKITLEQLISQYTVIFEIKVEVLLFG